MASSLEFVQYVCDQLADAGVITYKKMFGEYGIYCNGTFFATVEDDQFFVKPTDAGKEFLKVPVLAEPHEGSKMYLIEELEDRLFLAELTRRTCSRLKPSKLDYKKEYKDLYVPKTKPSFIDVPEMTFLIVKGKGDPNTSQEYKNALEILYGLSYTIKMSKMGACPPPGYFEYVVPPLEGLWYGESEIFHDGGRIEKDRLSWISMIRQPEFVTEQVFQEAKKALQKKKPNLDLGRAELTVWKEGLCAQVMHKGSYDDEPATIQKLEQFISKSGFSVDFSHGRHHHEIYLSDPRKTAPEKLKTVIRYPIKEAG